MQPLPERGSSWSQQPTNNTGTDRSNLVGRRIHWQTILISPSKPSLSPPITFASPLSSVAPPRDSFLPSSQPGTRSAYSPTAAGSSGSPTQTPPPPRRTRPRTRPRIRSRLSSRADQSNSEPDNSTTGSPFTPTSSRRSTRANPVGTLTSLPTRYPGLPDFVWSDQNRRRENRSRARSSAGALQSRSPRQNAAHLLAGSSSPPTSPSHRNFRGRGRCIIDSTSSSSTDEDTLKPRRETMNFDRSSVLHQISPSPSTTQSPAESSSDLVPTNPRTLRGRERWIQIVTHRAQDKDEDDM